MKVFIILFSFLTLTCSAAAQVGSYRNDLSVGFNAGYIMSNVGFDPKVSQGMHSGIMGGITAKYVCEKYFNTICSVLAEVNYSQLGWKEKILDTNDKPFINAVTGFAEEYSRTINYIQIPVFAHLAWGQEEKGFQFFFNLGPQFGLYLNESVKANFDYTSSDTSGRSNTITAQDTMSVENKFDYGIAAGIGVEYTVPKAGHFLFEGRYYYGLGNIYGNSKRDFFGKSNFGNIVVKVTYLFDLTKTKSKKQLLTK